MAVAAFDAVGSIVAVVRISCVTYGAIREYFVLRVNACIGPVGIVNKHRPRIV